MDMQMISGRALPAMGQGTWFMGEKPALAQQEIRALQCGVEHGMTLIDTAEMYGEGAAETLVGQAIRPFDRDNLFLVSKVYPHNAGGRLLEESCENSLTRLGVDAIDLYLLHWRGGIPFEETIDGMRRLQLEGKIRYWGVSNLDRYDMQELIAAGGKDCRVNQVLYHLGSRGVEYKLLPWLQKQRMLMMAYCPLAHNAGVRSALAKSAAVQQVAAQRGWTAAQVLLAFAGQKEGVLPIPKSSSEEHTLLNAAVMGAALTPQELALLEEAFPAPTYEEPLDML